MLGVLGVLGVLGNGERPGAVYWVGKGRRMTQEIPDRRLAWLNAELTTWQRDGLVDADQAAAITARYAPGRRASVVRLISVLGAAFVGVGLISLVASNLSELSPMVRFVGITAVWIGAVVVAEVLLRQDPRHDATGDGDPTAASLWVGAARLIAVAAYGATVFQAAQSLQVPAYSSGLLGCWSAGALAYAYASRGIGPLLVGIITGVGWFAWALGERAGDGSAFVVGLLAAAVAATAVGAAHEDRVLPAFGPPWSQAGALLALIALFGAALPEVGREGFDLPAAGVAGLAVAALLAAASAWWSGKQSRREIAAVLAMAVAGLLLGAWSIEETSPDSLSGVELLRAVFGTVVYLATAIWFAVVGAVRDRPQLTNLATAALVVFVTVQSFGVFSPLLSGAALFLLLGIVLIVVGAVADRGRRRIIEEVSE